MNSHPISGSFLLSTSVLEGSFFQNRIIFLADHSPQGSYGLILNHPLRIPLDEVFPKFQAKSRHPFPFFLGGPVQEEIVQVMEVQNSFSMNASEVVPGVFLHTMEPGSQPDPEFLAPPNTRIFLGYSGWGAHQLEAEIQQGCWEVFHSPAPLEILGRPREQALGTPTEFKKQFVLS